MTATYVCANGAVLAFPDVRTAIDAAIELASKHARVGIDVDEAGAIRIAQRALPGMVLCPRNDALGDVACYPLTTTTALVTPPARATAARPGRPLHEACVR